MARVQPGSGAAKWYAVRCLFEVPAGPPAIYEERITLWRADGFDDAITLAEAEAREYSLAVDGRYLDLAQCYALPDEPQHGAEVFSLMRESTLDRQTYLAQFFDTGSEHQEKS